ncbi:MAG: methyltransferase domain-containing protein [Aliidongia sp.]
MSAKSLDRALVDILACPETGAPLAWRGDRLVAASGTSYPVVRGIPRFVPSDDYVGSFSFEWNTHNRTQLDSFTGSGSSEAMFTAKTGLGPEDVRDKLVLDAGIGAGRFSDVLSRWGAKVIGVDLSYAVEAAQTNFRDRPNVLVVQADIGKLPIADETVDIIISIGVLHHTPSTERYFKALVPKLKRGGRISVWVYPDSGEYAVRNNWIPFTSRLPSQAFYEWCRWIVPRIYADPNRRWVQLLRRLFPFSDQGLGLENDILDTFDAYSPVFHGIHSPEAVARWFVEAGLADIEILGVPSSVTGVKS